MLNTFFERIYCINLPRRQDRRAHCERLFALLDWKVVWAEAVDGLNFPTLGRFHRGGEVGASLSHARVVADAIKDKLDNFLVLEDDLLVHRNIAELLPEYLKAVPGGWDVLYLGWIPWCTNYAEKVNDKVDRVWGMNGMHATGFRQPLFGGYLAELLKLQEHCDTCLARFQDQRGTYDCYCFHENLVAQGGFGSDACPHDGIWGADRLKDYL